MALGVLILPVLFRDAVTPRVDLASYSRRHLLIVNGDVIFSC